MVSEELAELISDQVDAGEKMQIGGLEVDYGRYMQIMEAIDENFEPGDTIIKSDLYQISKQSFDRLRPGKWLNDEIINAYVSLINQREKLENQGQVQTFAFNTFFYEMLLEMAKKGNYNFRKLQRIVDRQKVKLRSLKNIMIPINIKHCHWLLMALDLTENSFYILDSMGSTKQNATAYVKTVSQFI